MTIFEERRESTDKTLKNLASQLENHLGVDKQRILKEDTCIYIVGSGGRGEMTEHSDVDLFVARVRRAPSEVDAFQVRQAIARTLFDLGRPEASQGGDFLKMHTATGLCDGMGTPQDDAGNTFTARMLLLLESQPVLGDKAYEALLTTVIGRYLKDADAHKGNYQPFVLVNDVVRYWRILLLNYEAKNSEKERELQQPERDAERRLRSYKLRFSRCMTCFSVLAALLSITASGEVTANQIATIVKRRPVDRLRDLGASVETHVERLLDLYARFLEATNRKQTELKVQFANRDFRAERAGEGRNFGDAMFELLKALGGSNRGAELFRHMVV